MDEKTLKNQILESVKQFYHLKFKKQEFIPGESAIHCAEKNFDDKELVNLVESSLEFDLNEGKNIAEFEFEFSQLFNASSSILVNSGSSANLLAISSLSSAKLKGRKLKPGDEIITTAAGFPTTVAPIIQNGLIPVFIDINVENYNINTSRLEQAISPKTKAIILSHSLGIPFDIDAVKSFAKKYNLWLIEDNGSSLGSLYDGKLTGSFGDFATFSFNATSQITLGEGGAIITNNEELSKIARSIRDWGRDCYCLPGNENACESRFLGQYGKLPVGYDHKNVYSHIGYNLKLTELQAAIGVEQLKKLPQIIKRRKENFDILYNGLKKYDDTLILPQISEKVDPAWFGFIISIKKDAQFTRTELVKYLNENKIQTRNLFAGNILKQPAYEFIDMRIIGDLSNSDFVMSNSFFIGLHPGLGAPELNFVIQKFDDFFAKMP